MDFRINGLRFTNLPTTQHFSCLLFQITLLFDAKVQKVTEFYSRLPYFFSNNSVFLLPHSIIASIIGISVIPKGVMAYSERGGNSGKIVLETKPSSTNSFNCRSSTRGVASGNILWSSLGRNGLWRNSSKMQDFHFESIRLMVNRKGQSKSTGIFLSYINFSLSNYYATKISIITLNRDIPNNFSVYE